MASILSVNGHLAPPSGRIAAERLGLSPIVSENRYRIFRIVLLRMIVSENSESGFRKIMRKRAQTVRANS
jgi:hypothetical protein